MGNRFSRRRTRRSTYRSEQGAVNSDETGGPSPVDFNTIASTLGTGDICLLYRKGMEQPHCAMFVRYEDMGDNSPLLLLKGKTKPLPLEKFVKGRQTSHRNAAPTPVQVRKDFLSIATDMY